MRIKEVGYIVERLADRFRDLGGQMADQEAAHKAALTEIRASFNARTGADAKIIEGLRAAADEQVLSASKVAYVLRCAGETPVQAAQRVVKERDGLLTQVQDQRAEIERLRNDERKAYQDGEALRAEVEFLKTLRPKYKVGDKLESYNRSLGLAIPVTIVGVRTVYDCQVDGAEYPVGHSEDELKERYVQTPKHPVKVGEWVKASNGAVAQVLGVHKDWYLIARGHGWTFANCEPCDPPNHDTEAGKAAAESAVRTEPVAEEIKVGDVAKVVGASGDLTAQSDIGKIGEVLKIDFGDGTVLLSGGAGWVNRCDVRKVTT